jgi:proteasome lid subunit RPN8/RPN11
MRTKQEVLDQIRRHGEKTYPEEGCGFLLGEALEDGNVVVATLAVENSQEENRRRRYIITPDDYHNADCVARKTGLDIVGIFHSHPDHPARPSATDLAEATFPGFTYVIVSVQHGEADDLTAWQLAPDRSRFDPEPIHVEESPGAVSHTSNGFHHGIPEIVRQKK